MKNLLFIFLLIPSLLVAQAETSATTLSEKGPSKPDCVIGGPVIEGDEYTFSIPSGLAQCDDCYDWDFSSLSTTIGDPIVEQVGSDMSREFTLRVLRSGRVTINVTYFNEQGCHTCQKVIDVVGTEPPCFEPDMEGKVHCGPGGSSNNLVRLVGTNNISQVVWTFDPMDNVGYYQGFSFNNGTTLPDGRSFVVSTNPGIEFMEFFTLPGGANCAPNNLVCLKVDVTFTDGTCGGDWYDKVCAPFLIPAPLTTITPNPAESEVTVTLENLNQKDVELQLYAMNGELLQKLTTRVDSDAYSHSLTLPKVSGNMLLLKVVGGNQVIDTKKILLK